MIKALPVFFNLVPRALFPGFGKAPGGRGCAFLLLFRETLITSLS